MKAKESTLGAVRRYHAETGRWPTRNALAQMLPERVGIDARVDALVAQGLLRMDATGRIVSTVGKGSTESM